MSATQTSMSHCQVLIVGAGPTGLVLAAQLLARGVRTRVIDKGEGPARQSRAISIYARTLELLDTMGLAETFIAHGHQVHRLHWYAGKRTLLNLDLARNGSRYGFVLHLPQNETERLLRARVRDLGGGIEQGVELVRLAQHGNAVDATLRDATGRDIELSADYVVGCDGARSRVRHELGLAFEGQPYRTTGCWPTSHLTGPAATTRRTCSSVRTDYRWSALRWVVTGGAWSCPTRATAADGLRLSRRSRI